MTMVQQKIGIMPRMIFAFSTCVTLQSFHGFRASGLSKFRVAVVWIAALSRYLKIDISIRFLHENIA